MQNSTQNAMRSRWVKWHIVVPLDHGDSALAVERSGSTGGKRGCRSQSRRRRECLFALEAVVRAIPFHLLRRHAPEQHAHGKAAFLLAILHVTPVGNIGALERDRIAGRHRGEVVRLIGDDACEAGGPRAGSTTGAREFFSCSRLDVRWKMARTRPALKPRCGVD